MKTDLNKIMQDRNIDALLVLGDAEHNAPMYYLTGGGHVNAATLIKPRGEEATLFHNDMEREEAAKSKLKTIPYSKYPLKTLMKEAKEKKSNFGALRLQKMLEDCGVTSGKIGVYGHTDLSNSFSMLTAAQKLMPEIEFIGESGTDSVFLQAMETKTEDETKAVAAYYKVLNNMLSVFDLEKKEILCCCSCFSINLLIFPFSIFSFNSLYYLIKPFFWIFFRFSRYLLFNHTVS